MVPLGLWMEGPVSHVPSSVKTVGIHFFELRLISKVQACLPLYDLERVILAFLTSRLDDYSALCVSMGHTSIQRLQLVQNFNL